MVMWPFPGGFKQSEIRRVDEGQDLQYPGTTPVPIHAIASGTITKLGPDPGGFGVAYPGETLDTPIAGHRQIYYGHTFLDPGIVGQHVQAGQVIAHTGGAHSGGDAFNDPNWLELGFWPPSFSQGQAMANVLKGATPASGGGIGTTAFNPLNPASWITSLFAPFGGDIKGGLERLGLILLGGALIFVGIYMIAGKKTIDIILPKSSSSGAKDEAAMERKLGEPKENPELETGRGAIRETSAGTRRRKMTAREYASPDTSGAEMEEIPF